MTSTANRTFFLSGCVAIIVLGSLYPFDFQLAVPSGHFDDWLRFSNQADLVANILLFLPFGFAATLVSFTPRALLGWAAVGVALAFGLQIAQVFLHQRDPAIWDAIANTMGLIGGYAAARHVAGPHSAESDTTVPMSLAIPVVCYLAFMLAPFVPVSSIKSLTTVQDRYLSATAFDVMRILPLVIAQLSVYAVLCIWRDTKQARFLLSGLTLLVFFVRPLIAESGATSSDHVGLLLGLAMALVWAPQAKTNLMVVGMLLATYTLGGTLPFELRDDVLLPSLLPLYELIEGWWALNAITISWKLLVFSCAIVLIHAESDHRYLATTAVVGAAVFVETVQVFMVGSNASTLDIWIAAALALLLFDSDVQDVAVVG